MGQAVDLTYDYTHLGTDGAALAALNARDHGGDILEKPSLVILGQGGLRGADGPAVLAAAMELAEQTQSGLLILHMAAGRVGAMDVGATTQGGVEAALDGADLVFNLGADEIELADGPFVIYQGSHGDRGAHRADIILPAAAYTEESGLFVNTEGRPQMALRAGFPPGEAKENWAILRALSAGLDAVLPYDSIGQLRDAMGDSVPHLAMLDCVPENNWYKITSDAAPKAELQMAVGDHYLTNPIARASSLMADLSAAAADRAKAPIAAE